MTDVAARLVPAPVRAQARRVSSQTWTAIVSAGCFVSLAAALALVKVPFVSWSPGSTVDLLATQGGKPVVQVSGTKTWPVTGELRMTTVQVTRADSFLGLPEALAAYWLPNRDVLPRDMVYPRGKSAQEVRDEEVEMMDDSKADAVVAALRAAKIPVTEMPQVRSVVVSGPSYQKLEPGDLIQKVDQTDVQTMDDVKRIVSAHKVGDAVVFTVLRDGVSRDVTVNTIASNDSKTVPVVGIKQVIGYRYAPGVSYGIDPNIVGPSAGLVFSLAIYDQITEGDLVGGRKIAGTGGIGPDGAVSSIGGIQEKIAAAERAGAKIFLVPAGNCVDLGSAGSSMDLLKVSTLADTVAGLQALRDGNDKEVPRC